MTHTSSPSKDQPSLRCCKSPFRLLAFAHQFASLISTFSTKPVASVEWRLKGASVGWPRGRRSFVTPALVQTFRNQEMEGLFSASGSLLSMPLPLSGGSSDGHRPVLKSTSLSRLEELQQELRQCSDPQHVRKLFKKLSSCPADIVDAYANYLKDKAAHLATEEQREYKRAKLLNVLGDASAQPCLPHDDAFCAKVLGEEFPEEECVTPSNPRHVSRQPAARRGDDAAGALLQQEQPRQPAALAAHSSQQRGGDGSVFREDDLQLPHSHLSRLKTAPTPPLFSPLHYVTITDHQLQHLMSPLPYSLTPQGEVLGSSLRQLQAQLEVKPDPSV